METAKKCTCLINTFRPSNVFSLSIYLTQQACLSQL